VALAEGAARRPRLTVGIVAVLAIGCGLLSLGLKPSAASNTFVSSSTASYQATQADHRAFGGDAVIVLVHEPLTDLVESSDLATISQLEACLAGDVIVPDQQLRAFRPAPAGALPAYGGPHSPCGKLMKYRPAKVVYGPGTFLNRAVAAVGGQIVTLENATKAAMQRAERAAYQLAIARHLTPAQARAAATAAGQLEYQQQTQQLAQLALNSGIRGLPSIDDATFISQIVFDNTRGVNQPKARFSYLFPTKNAALIQVRLRASLTQSQVSQAITWIRQAVRMKQFRSKYGGTYTVTGEPVVVDDLASQITNSIVVLLLGAVAVMALMLLLVFRGTLRLLPLGIALAASAITFGVTSLAGASLTMASIAVLPILIGLAVDYAIQFQSRAREAAPAPAAEAVSHAARHGAPTIAAAALATGTGFLVLLLSPVPMVRGFGVLLVIGIAIAFFCALTAGSAALVLAARDLGAFGASLRGAGEILGDAGRRLRRALATIRRRRGQAKPPPANRRPRGRALGAAATWITARPGRVLAVGCVLALAGWIADTQTSVQSDITKLVPSNMVALRNLHELERVTGVSGEIDVTVHGLHGASVATPATIGWMTNYESRLLSHFGYLETKGCAAATLCPALSLPDLFSTGAGQSATGAPALSAGAVTSLLKAVPTYFSEAVITPDHRDAVLSFGIRLMPLSRQQRVIDYMCAQLHPPPGVSVRLAGLPVLAAQADAALSSSGRRLLTLIAGLVAVGLVLLAVFRTPGRALVPLVPIALATGWSALILFVIGIPLNPMSATLGALVIAISTEFSVLLSERYGQERVAGGSLAEALGRTYRSTGAAVVASGLTAIAGFGVLMLSDITMLRDFGFVTVIDMSVSLAGVLLVLPAVLVVAERGDLLGRLRAVPRRASAALPRRRRRARVA
jgi:hydrophobe/amphiphile efflux-3 (HAE3) family protein